MLKRMLIICALIVFSTVSTMAKECELIPYYSRKEFVEYFDLIDVNFENATFFKNSKDLTVNLNGFGPYSFTNVGHAIYPVSSDNLNGKSPLVVKAVNEHQDFYSTFVMDFGSRVKLHDLDLALDIKDESGNHLDYEIYIRNGNGLNKVYDGQSKNEIININLNKIEADSLYIRAKNPRNGLIYTLKYLEINEYEIYEHVEWVKDYIANTEVIDMEYCKATGEYRPNGNDEYVKMFKTLFVPSGQKINDRVGKEKRDEWNRYNDGLDIGINKDSPPDYDLMYLWGGGDKYLEHAYGFTPSNKPFYWKRSGNSYIAIDSKTNSEYIPVSSINHRLVYLKIHADMVRCENYNCDLNVGKRMGHGNNPKENAYDTYVEIYYGGAIQSHSNVIRLKISQRKYDGTFYKELEDIIVDRSDNLENYATELKIEETGKWLIDAYMYNQIGDYTYVRSNYILVDNIKPEIIFDNASDKAIPGPIDVKVVISDKDSRPYKWRYAVSKDAGKTFGPYSDWFYKDKAWTSEDILNVKLIESGKNVIKVNAYDKAQNVSVKISPIYHIREEPPTLILKENIYFKDEVVNNEELKKNVIANDSVDGDISDKAIIEKIEYEDGRVVIKPDGLDTSKVQKVTITYSVTNSAMISISKSKVYEIIDSEASLIEINNDSDIYNRFIDKDSLDSLNDKSIWLNDLEFKRILETSLNNDSGKNYQVN